MNKMLPPTRKFSGIEQVYALIQTAEREKEIHRLQHNLNASKFECQSTQQELSKQREINNQLEKDNEKLDNELVQQISDNIKLRGENQRLKSALEYYENAENYKHIPLFRTAEVLIDKGSFARYVLGGSNE